MSYDLSNLQDSASAEANGMVSCQGCGRTFAPGPYEKHERICAKVRLLPAPLQQVHRTAWTSMRALDGEVCSWRADERVGWSALCRHCHGCPCMRRLAPGQQELTAHAGQVFQSKRKPLNMKEQRASSELGADGTFGAPPPLPPKGRKGVRAVAASLAEPPAAARKAVPKWKAQSGQLRAAMAAARGDLPFDAPPVVDEVSFRDALLSRAWSCLLWNVLQEGLLGPDSADFPRPPPQRKLVDS